MKGNKKTKERRMGSHMKTQFGVMIACTTVCLAAGGAFAQAGSGSSPSSGTQESTSTRESSMSREFFHSKSVVGADAKDSQGQKLGDIHDIVFNPQSGQAFATISVSRDTYALIPVQALNITRSTGM